MMNREIKTISDKLDTLSDYLPKIQKGTLNDKDIAFLQTCLSSKKKIFTEIDVHNKINDLLFNFQLLCTDCKFDLTYPGVQQLFQQTKILQNKLILSYC